MEQNFANLFGSQIRDYADRVMADLNNKLSQDCSRIDQSIALIQLQIDTFTREAQTDSGDALKKSNLVLERTKTLLDEYKQIKIQKCWASTAPVNDWSTPPFLPTNTTDLASSLLPNLPRTNVPRTNVPTTNVQPNYLLWGGIAAVVIIGGLLIARR
jgi:hypothetical protein